MHRRASRFATDFGILQTVAGARGDLKIARKYRQISRTGHRGYEDAPWFKMAATVSAGNSNIRMGVYRNARLEIVCRNREDI